MPEKTINKDREQMMRLATELKDVLHREGVGKLNCAMVVGVLTDLIFELEMERLARGTLEPGFLSKFIK